MAALLDLDGNVEKACIPYYLNRNAHSKKQQPYPKGMPLALPYFPVWKLAIRIQLAQESIIS